jgi:hypothetical protein
VLHILSATFKLENLHQLFELPVKLNFQKVLRLYTIQWVPHFVGDTCIEQLERLVDRLGLVVQDGVRDVDQLHHLHLLRIASKLFHLDLQVLLFYFLVVVFDLFTNFLNLAVDGVGVDNHLLEGRLGLGSENVVETKPFVL